MALLLLDEARRRAELITVTSYDIDLNLDSGDETFESLTHIRFRCVEPGAETFLDLKADTVHEIRLNGAPVDPAEVHDERLTLRDLQGDNEVVVRATMRYSRDGQGLHRAVDPADGQHYVYGHLFLDAAPKVYACFDQPDLKAPYDVRVTVPAGWQVMGNGDRTQVDETHWVLGTTKPLATYFVTVCAGPYATVSDEHAGVPLFVHARASLREQLEAQAPDILEVTKQGLDYYQPLFGIDYPFGEYHQVFVPEFNAGAMENPGCVTFRDQLIFRGVATDEELSSRANTVLHEMAHMWFGDLVTLKWWDDLWLNESFAEYMAHRTSVAATKYTSAWVDFSIQRKAWGYMADRLPSTHPVAGNPPPDAQTALQNFDGISYAKGASVLRQLIAYLGDDVFVAGVARYLARHADGNATLADFLAAMEEASGRAMGPWSDAWLRTARNDTLRLETTTDGTVITAATLRREAPAGESVSRPHTLDIAGYDGEQVWRVPVTIEHDETSLPELVGRPVAPLTVLNASDLTWATTPLPTSDLAALPQQLPTVPDPLARSVVILSLTSMLAAAEIDPREYLRVVTGLLPHETEPGIVGSLSRNLTERVLAYVLPESERAAAEEQVAAAAEALIEATSQETLQVAAYRLVALVGAPDRVRAWARGEELPGLLAQDPDFRWLALRNLAGRGEVGLAELEAAAAEDQTLPGQLSFLQARASLPTAEAKAWAWDQIVGDYGRSNYELNALAEGFWEGDGLEVAAPYAQRWHTDIPALAGRVGEDALARVTALTFPMRVVTEEQVEASRQTLARTDLTAAVRRSLVDSAALQEEVLASRQRYFA